MNSAVMMAFILVVIGNIMKDIIKFKSQYGTLAAARLLRAHGVSLSTALLLARKVLK